MNDENFLRNHWSYLLAGIVRSLMIGFFIGIYAAFSAEEASLYVFTLILVIVTGISSAITVIIWLRTKYYFLENEIVVTRYMIFRSETRIQYDRLASVVIERSVIYRIFGATKLSFNLNSSVNVRSAEAYIVLEVGEAEELRKTVYARIYGSSGTEVPEGDTEVAPDIPDYGSMESLVHVTTGDIFLHSFLGMPSLQFAFGMAMLAYSLLSLFVFESPSFFAILIFVVEFFIPAISKFFRYYDYRIVRDGDTVIISSGLFSTRQDSFKLSKVNFVKVREPIICRVMGRAILEAEVVGTADKEGLPLLCPLKKKEVAIDLFRSLLPEFQCDVEQHSQSRASLYGIAVIMAAAVSALVIVLLLLLPEIPGDYDLIAYAVFGVLVLTVLGWGHLTYHVRTFAMTDSIALMVTGSYDRLSNYVLIDKVQYADVRSSPVQRRFGTARCTVNMLSTNGYANIRSGVFDAEVLECLSNTVLDRIKDGRYDFRLYQ